MARGLKRTVTCSLSTFCIGSSRTSGDAYATVTADTALALIAILTT